MTKKTTKRKTSKEFARGLKIRREVVGDDYVDRALATAGEVGRPLQELVTEYCWGRVWGRGGLSRRDRSLLNLGMLAALNRPHELRVHVRGALVNGLSKAQIVEAVLQIGIYCGIPAAVDGMRVVQATFEEAESAKRGRARR